MLYEIYSMTGEKITSFQSDWQFNPGEQIFLHQGDSKRNLVVNHITHDVLPDKHIIRLTCHDKKVFF